MNDQDSIVIYHNSGIVSNHTTDSRMCAWGFPHFSILAVRHSAESLTLSCMVEIHSRTGGTFQKSALDPLYQCLLLSLLKHYVTCFHDESRDKSSWTQH